MLITDPERIVGAAIKAVPARNWFIVLLFLACLACSFVDRQVISLMIEPIKQDLHLSDSAIGLLQGFAFTLCFSVAGLPLGRLIDRGDRITIASACVVVWTVGTAGGAFATNYVSLIATRALTAAAEAGVSPAALSVISDIFPRGKVSRATSVYMLGPYVGTAIAMIGGGALLSHFEAVGGLSLHRVGTLAPWRSVFILIALPGIVLALLLRLAIRDPAHARTVTTREPQLISLWPTLVENRRFLIPYMTGVVLTVLVTYSQMAWFPTFLIRVFHFEAGHVGNVIGPIYLLCGILGAITASMFSTTARGDPLQRVLTLMALAAASLIVTSTTATLVANPSVAFVMFALSTFAGSILLALVPCPLQLVAPPEVRAQVITAASFVFNVLGAGLGSFLVGMITDHVLGDAQKVGLSLALVCGVSTVLGSITLARARMHTGAARSTS
jgi:predicted MFS family arabinose efflux permease